MNTSDANAGLTGLVTFTFGDNVDLCTKLLHLVRSGRKTATCEALRKFAAGKEHMPVVGRRDVALNWDGTPALLIETTEVTEKRFCDVDESFALAEGEHDDLHGWRRDHQKYFERTGGFDPEMMLVCERFRLVHEF
ncbi:MAG: ASCH domain-containing protein [Gammaproteobacteria bacterium]|nr:ASCH domain-containing protein [Gammaproteobacteria bacterium]MDH5302783.1 ASCH domain-containing protein [Gammaproteobacteria bacterium]